MVSGSNIWYCPSSLQLTLLTDDEDCAECEVVLEALEEIDDEADLYGIDFVKSESQELAKNLAGVYATPALVYFRKKIPLVYDGGETTKLL